MSKRNRIKNLEKQYRECSDENSEFFKKHVVDIHSLVTSIVSDKDCPDWIKQDYFMRKDFFDNCYALHIQTLEALKQHISKHRFQADQFWIPNNVRKDLLDLFDKEED